MPADQTETHPSEESGLAELAGHVRDRRFLLIAHSEAQAARLAASAAALVPELSPVLLPGWDCLAYDRASPSRAVMGQRMRAVRAIAAGEARLVIASPEAAVQLLPPPGRYRAVTIQAGQAVHPGELCAELARLGFTAAEEADQPGDMTHQGAVLDVVPADGQPALRIRLEGEGDACTVAEIDRLDPATQRSAGVVACHAIGPASELVVGPDESAPDRVPGLEHSLPELAGPLASAFELAAGAEILLDPQAAERAADHLAQIEEARATRLALCRASGGALPPDGLYLKPAAWSQATKGASQLDWPHAGRLPAFRANRNPAQAARTYVAAQIATGRRVGLSGSRLARALGVKAMPCAGWAELAAAPAGTVAVLPDGVARGFATESAVLIAASDVLPPRHGHAAQDGLFNVPLRPGDAVIHLDYGMARLDGIETITAAHPADHLVLGFAGGARKLVDCAETDRIWRYGSGSEGVSLDRADGASWAKRRATMLASLDETAKALVAEARARAETTAPALRPPRREMDRFVAGFAFTPTPDQDAAFADIAADLARPHPMDRLLCGDVGFGKTEAALRAAAAAALSGRQVAILAPTTVLVRQHLATFRRRFAALGVEVAALSRLTRPADARAIAARLADGSLRVVIGTQALAAEKIVFSKLGLVIIDEEQRFGTKAKAALARIKDGVHTLTLTATPIPRTLQGALAGLQTISVLTTPPARRQPVRTTVSEEDEAVIRTALLREHARGGQSFCVCPRIEDLDRLAAQLHRLVPDLSVITLHGRMKPDALDAVLVGFAEGHGDVLLSTDIIEAGLDIPRANTILVWRADQFGLAQLHQLRGRVGRGRARGMAWLFTDPAHPPTQAAASRLAALEAHDGLGAGFAVAAADLDQRGAGDLLGDAQAGHAKLLGVELARYLLARAMAQQRGETVDDMRPELVLDVPAYIPAAYMADPAARVALHVRLGRAPDTTALAEELEDRFGKLPDELANLLALSGLRAHCRALGVKRLEAGPAGVAADLVGAAPEVEGLERKGARLILRDRKAARLEAAGTLLEMLEGVLARTPVTA